MNSRIFFSVQGPLTKQKHYLKTLPVLCLLSLLLACSRPPEHPDIPRLKAQLAAGDKRLEELDLELKSSKGDPATTSDLTEERALLSSRMERVREMLAGLGVHPESKSGGGGH